MAEGTPYTVWHAMEGESLIEGGVKVSARQQRTALEAAGVSYTESGDGEWDVLHLNFPGPNSLAALFRAKRADKPVVCHAHSIGENIAGTYRFSRFVAPPFKRYLTWFYRQADVVIAVSEFTADRLRANGVSRRIEVISNGVDADALDGFGDLDTDVNAKYDADPPVVVNLAQVYDLKGVPTFVTAGEALPEVEFRWFGPEFDLLAPSSTKQAVSDAPDNVRFPGFVDDKREAFALGDVFFAPTHHETQGMAILEAMYCGLPVVVRDIPAFEGWLEHGHNCLKGASAAEFVEEIERLVDDPALREELGANARETAQDHTLDVVGEQLRAVYDDVVSE